MLRKFILVIVVSIFVSSCSKDDGSNGTDDNSVVANLQPTGSSSNDLLSDNQYKSMLIEMVYVEGFEPTQSSINNVVNFVESRTFKPNGITVELRSIASPQSVSYSIADARDVEESNRNNYNTSDQIAVWVFFANFQSESDTNESVVLGTAYRNTSMIIFESTLQGLSNQPGGPSRTVLETTVLNHEFGHIMGLTNLGAPLQSPHEDAENPKHCDVPSCLMYFAAETGAGIMGMVTGGTVPQLDPQCIADLQANGGK